MRKTGKDKHISQELYPTHLSAMVEKKIEELLGDYSSAPSELAEPLRYCMLNPGKRFRPVLSLAAAVSLGKKPEVVLPAACAIEFIHSYSLIHDDLPAIDNDSMRRGKPSCHVKFGEDIAILTGDALFAEAFRIILRYQKGTPDMIVRALSEVSEASGATGMVAGQIVDISASGKDISRDLLEYMHMNKTAKLISAAVTVSAILCGAEDSIVEGLREYGLNIGLAFQITDDILDIVSASQMTGKTQGKDDAQLKNTYPRLWGIDRSREIVREKVSDAVKALDGLDIDTQILKDLANFILVRRS